MAVNVSKIPNRKDFDAVREAILQVDANISDIIEGEGLVSSVAGITGDVLVTGDAVSVNVATKTITINAGTANDGVLTIAQGSGITISDPNTFSANQSTNRTITITNSSPDQIVTWSQVGSNIAITGNYPNFAADLTSTVTISGTLTAGNLTTGGTLTATNVSATNGTFTDSLTLDGKSVINELSAKGAITFEGVQQISANTDTWGVESQTWESSTLPEGTTSFTILHQDTSSQADVYNTGGNVIQSIGLDTYGHLGSIGSVNLDDRYLAFRTISVGGLGLVADSYQDTLSITSSDGITITTGDDSFNIAGDDKFKFIYTTNDNRTASPAQFDDILTFKGAGSIAVTKSATANELRFGLAVSDIRFEDGVRVARGFLYWQSNTVPTAGDVPSAATFSFDTYFITTNDSNWSEIPPTTGYSLTTYYITRYTSIDSGAGTSASRSVTFSDPEDSTGFEGPVTFNSLSEELGSNGFTIIDGGRIKTGQIQSVGLNASDYDQGLSVYTQQGSLFNLGNGDIVTPEFSVVSGNANFKGSVTVGATVLTEQNTLNSNTTASDVSGLGELALLDSVDATSAQVTGLAALAFLADIDLSYITDAGSMAAINKITTGNATTYIDDNSIVTQLIAANAIVADKIAANAITAGKLATDAIQSTNLNPSSPLPTDFTTAGTYLDLANGNFYSEQFKIVNGSASYTGSVTVGQITDLSTTLADYVTDTDLSTTLGDYVLTTSLGELATLDNITLEKVTNAGALAALSTVDTVHIEDGAIIGSKILVDTAFVNKLTAADILSVDGTFTGTLIAGDVSITDDEITIKNSNTGTAPSSKIKFTNSTDTLVGIIEAGKLVSGTVVDGINIQSETDDLFISSDKNITLRGTAAGTMADNVDIQSSYTFFGGKMHYVIDDTSIGNGAFQNVCQLNSSVDSPSSKALTIKVEVSYEDNGTPAYYEGIFVAYYTYSVGSTWTLSSISRVREEGNTDLRASVFSSTIIRLSNATGDLGGTEYACNVTVQGYANEIGDFLEILDISAMTYVL